MVTNPNCSTIGLVMALKPIEERFGIEQIFVTTMQAVSRRGLSRRGVDGHSGQRGALHRRRRRKDGGRDAEAAGQARRPRGGAAGREDDRALQPRAGGGRAHGVRVDQAGQEVGRPRRAKTFWRRGRSSSRWPGSDLPFAPEQPVEWARAERSPAAAAGPQSRQGHGGDGGPAAPVQRAGLEVRAALAQHRARRGRSDDFERRDAGQPGQAGTCGGGSGARARARNDSRSPSG